jgi:hypothetical protein
MEIHLKYNNEVRRFFAAESWNEADADTLRGLAAMLTVKDGNRSGINSLLCGVFKMPEALPPMLTDAQLGELLAQLDWLLKNETIFEETKIVGGIVNDRLKGLKFGTWCKLMTLAQELKENRNDTLLNFFCEEYFETTENEYMELDIDSKMALVLNFRGLTNWLCARFPEVFYKQDAAEESEALFAPTKQDYHALVMRFANGDVTKIKEVENTETYDVLKMWEQEIIQSKKQAK